MEWLRSPENPYFAKAIVNRVWSNYFGIGIVDPTDDMNLANPPSNAPLLDHLASEFIAHDFDLKWLHRTIVTSDTYQRSAETNATNAMDRTNFSHHVPRTTAGRSRLRCGRLGHRVRRASQRSFASELDEMAIAEGKAASTQPVRLCLGGLRSIDSRIELRLRPQRLRPACCSRSTCETTPTCHRRLADKNGWVAQACKALGVERSQVRPARPQPDSPTSAAPMACENSSSVGSGSSHKLPEDRQNRMRPQLRTEYDESAEKIKQYGYARPTVGEIDRRSRMLERTGDRRSTVQTQGTATIDKSGRGRLLANAEPLPRSRGIEISIAFIEESKIAGRRRSIVAVGVGQYERVHHHALDRRRHMSRTSDFHNPIFQPLIEPSESTMKLHQTCDGMKRRDMLKAGALTVGGLTLSNYLRMAEAGQLASRASRPSDLHRTSRRTVAPGHVRPETGRTGRVSRVVQSDRDQRARHPDFRASAQAGLGAPTSSRSCAASATPWPPTAWDASTSTPAASRSRRWSIRATGPCCPRNAPASRTFPARSRFPRAVTEPDSLGIRYAALETNSSPSFGQPYSVRGISLAGGIGVDEVKRRQEPAEEARSSIRRAWKRTTNCSTGWTNSASRPTR